MKPGHRKTLMLIAKCLVAGGLIVVLCRQVHLHDYTVAGADGKDEVRRGLISIVRGIDVLLLAAGSMGFLLSQMVVAVRWWMLLRIQRIRIGLWEAVRLTFLGQFFNTVVPGTVGGDLVKAYYVAKHTPKKGAVLVSVFVDRVLGMTELTLLASVMVVVSLAAGLERFERIRTAVISTIVVLGIVIFAMTFLLSRRFRSVLHLQKLYQRLPVAHHIAAAGQAAELYRKRLPYLFRAIVMTFGAHVVWVGGIALLGFSLRLPVPWYQYFLYVPLIYIIGAIPLTPGGVGLVEGLYLMFLGASGASANQLLALALLARIIPIIWSLPGAVVAITGPKLPKADAMRHELEDAADSAGAAGQAK